MTHGTPTAWRHHRCRCPACHQAIVDEARLSWALRRVRAGADPATRVPVNQTRRHVRKLQRAGLTRARIAERAGVSAATITRVSKRKTKLISRITAAAILTVDP